MKKPKHRELNITDPQTISNTEQMSYLKNPAAMRKLMNRVKPAQTPPRPKMDGAYSKNKEDIAPTTIYTSSKIMWFINEIWRIKTHLSDKVPESQKYVIP